MHSASHGSSSSRQTGCSTFLIDGCRSEESFMTPSSQSVGSSEIPGRFNCRLPWLLGMKSQNSVTGVGHGSKRFTWGAAPVLPLHVRMVTFRTSEFAMKALRPCRGRINRVLSQTTNMC